MDAKVIFNKIEELGKNNSEREELRKFCKSKLEKVYEHLPRRILENDGGNLLECIFNGLPEHNSNIKIKVIDIVLQTMRKESMSINHCANMLSRICLELPRLPLDHLVRWTSDSIQSIIEDSDVNMIWKDILPECLNAISQQDTVQHCGTEMSGAEFKIQCVHTLCQCKWAEKQLVQLTAMFKDFQLARTEHKQVVNKICSYMVDIPPDTLPPLVHQLLKLCKVHNIEVVLSHISHYFNLNLYSKLEPPPQDSESTTMDVDDIVQHSPAELSRCLSTCLYHFSQGAAEAELIRKHLKQWPKTQLLRSPFLIDLSLVFSDKGAEFKSVCLDVIRSAIELRILDELRSKESAWVRYVLPPDVDIVNLLKVLTTESGNHRQLTVMGLINLAFCLLAVPRVKPTAPACWSHGKLILVRLCKAQPETAGHILSQLADKMFGDYNQQQYTDCLYILCKLTPVSVERCAALLTILESCQPLGSGAARAYAAVRPLLAYSTRVRDALVMVCRKGLYSRDSAYRCLALSGFLTLLRHLKLSREPLASSQGSAAEQYGAHSYLTQLTVDMHATSQGVAVSSRVRNETICLEVLSILRRCLMQDAAVKQLLFTEMYDCTKEKPALHELILELFYEHLTKYLPDDDESSPLLLEKCVQVTGMSATLIEPIGRLLYVISQFLQVAEESEDILGSQSENGSEYLKNKLTGVMEKLCKSDLLADIKTEDLTDLSSDSKANSLKVQQIMQCYEALIAYRIMKWDLNNENANSIHTLYKAYNQLLETTKGSPKSKKNKTLNETKETLKSQASQKSEKIQKGKGKDKEKGKRPNKMSNMAKDRAAPYKPLPCLWDFQLCSRVLDLLYSENVPWCSVEQRNHIRVRCDFHLFALRCIQSTLSENLDKMAVSTHVVRFASILYKRCLCRFKDMCDFDDITTVACLELFKSCLNLLLSSTYSLKIEGVLSRITGNTEKTASACLAEILDSLHSALAYLESVAAEESLDITRKKMLTVLVQITTLLLETPVLACNELNGVVAKLEEYVRGSTQAEALPLLFALLGALRRDHRDAPLLTDVLRKLAKELGRVEDDESSDENSVDPNFPTIKCESRSCHAALSQLCVQLSHRFKCTEHLLSRARDLSAALSVAAHSHQQRIELELIELYKAIVVQLRQLSGWACEAGSLRCAVGGGSDRVLLALVRLYALMAALVKQLDPKMAEILSLDRLLKFTAKKLSSVMDSLITYVESAQQQQARWENKVLRDTKLIPRLVLEAEQFSKHVILLGNKANLNFQQYLPLGTARDFKIDAPLLQGVVTNQDEETSDREEEDNINEVETVHLSQSGSDEENDSDEEDPKKKRKRMS